MTRKKDAQSIFTGITEEVNEFFEVQLYPSKRRTGKILSYKNKEFQQLFLSGGREVNFFELMQKIDRRIRRNMAGAVASSSEENWRFERNLGTKADADRPSKEVILERDIVTHIDENWVNQVPTCSGLCGGTKDGKRSVDLIERCPNGYTLYELKISEKSGAPIFAAVELIGYALTYLIFREDRNLWGKKSDKCLLTSPRIRLRVLGPASYYTPWLSQYKQQLLWFAESFSASIQKIAAQKGVEMNFAFALLGKDFEPGLKNDADGVRNAIEQITVIGQAGL